MRRDTCDRCLWNGPAKAGHYVMSAPDTTSRVRCLQLGNGARPQVGRGRWQGNRKRTPGTGSRGHRDPAAVGCHDLSDERKTQPVAVDLAGNGIGTAIERVEDVRQLGGWNAV